MHKLFTNTFQQGALASGVSLSSWSYPCGYLKTVRCLSKEELEFIPKAAKHSDAAEPDEKLRKNHNHSYYYAVVKPISKTIHNNKKELKEITVPKDFLSDGASSIAMDCIGEHHWLMHDWLYSTHGKPDFPEGIAQDNADEVFKRDNWWRYWALYYFGKRAWDESGSRGPEFLVKHPKTGTPLLKTKYGYFDEKGRVEL